MIIIFIAIINDSSPWNHHSEFQLRAVRDPSTGEVIDWKEIIVEEVIFVHIVLRQFEKLV